MMLVLKCLDYLVEHNDHNCKYFLANPKFILIIKINIIKWQAYI